VSARDKPSGVTRYLRLTSVALLVAVQALASPVAAAVYRCSMAPEPTKCRCPHSAAIGDEHEEDRLSRSPCCEVTQAPANHQAAASDHARGAAPAVAMVAAPWAWASASPALVSPVERWAFAVSAQGPPIFLKVRALLR
jgi:hypothetical protein